MWFPFFTLSFTMTFQISFGSSAFFSLLAASLSLWEFILLAQYLH